MYANTLPLFAIILCHYILFPVLFMSAVCVVFSDNRKTLSGKCVPFQVELYRIQSLPLTQCQNGCQ